MNKNIETEIVTFGCRLNSYESEIIKKHAKENNLKNTIIINTCAVTKEAERQARQKIRKLKRENPHKKIIVTGCAAQINPENWSKLDEVDLVIGNEEKLDKNYIHPHIFSKTEEKILVNDIMSIEETAAHMIDGFEERARAFMQVQQGCDHRCTFCIIPFGRGPSRSLPVGAIATQAQKLLDAGFKEIVLTGVDLTSYGHDLPGQPSLGQMIKRLLNLVPNIKRLRISSIDPAEIDEDLYHLMSQDERILPYIHLSLQAGDNMILKRMKRRHLRDDAINLCQKLQKDRPDIVFGADVIAGFPTETEEMFQNTLDCIEKCNLLFLHVFPYSEREGTPAAKMPSVPIPTRKARAKILRSYSEKQLFKKCQTFIGQTKELLIEKNNIGRTKEFIPVKIEGTNLEQGDIIYAKIEKYEDNMLKGTKAA